MSEFGDLDDDDVFATEPADPEQVARLVHRFRRDSALETADWDELTLAQQTILIVIIDRLLTLLRRQGSNF